MLIGHMLPVRLAAGHIACLHAYLRSSCVAMVAMNAPPKVCDLSQVDASASMKSVPGSPNQ
jgi:hypothetical protein